MYNFTKFGFLLLAVNAMGCTDVVDDTSSHESDIAFVSDDETTAAPEGSLLTDGEDSAQVAQQDTVPPTTAAVGCTSYDCDYQDPSAMGCWAGAQLLRTAWISFSSSFLAKVEGWYSPYCGAQWTRVINWWNAPTFIEAYQGQNGVAYGKVSSVVPLNGSVTSRMFSAAYFLQACGTWGTTYANCSTGY